MVRFIAIFLLAATLWLAWALLIPVAPPAPQVLLFPAGSSSKSIAAELEGSGVVRSQLAFQLLHYVTPRQTLKAGEYRFVRPASGLEVFNRIARGDVLVRTVVVPEGYNVFEIAAAIEAAGLGRKADFLTEAMHDTSLIRAIDPEAKSLEGYLVSRHLPVFPHHEHARDGRDHGQTLPEGGADARPAAGLASPGDPRLHCRKGNRCARRAFRGCQRLPQPPGEKHGPRRRSHRGLWRAAQGQLSRRHLPERSAIGLALQHLQICRTATGADIANPGAASLEAAQRPADTAFLFFVAAGDGSGRHRFSANFEQHERNVIAYRKAARAR